MGRLITIQVNAIINGLLLKAKHFLKTKEKKCYSATTSAPEHGGLTF